MQRRKFIALLGGAATWPLAARAQQDQCGGAGVLSALAEDDPESVAAARRSSRRSTRWVGPMVVTCRSTIAGVQPDDPDRARKLVAEIIALAPDVILMSGTSVVTPLMQATRIIPIVFVQVVDPVGAGLRRKLGTARWQHYRLYPI